ncbi:hypothetical protein SCALM49S_06615 [Streptomyces californicus]
MAAMTLDLVPGDAHAPAVDKALAWIAGRQLADGGFPGASGNSVNSAGLAVQGLSLDAEKYDAQITKALKFLTSQQNKDGGFNVAKNGQRVDIRASAQAVGGATGISFGVLSRSLEGTTPNPVPSSSAPVIVTPGENGGRHRERRRTRRRGWGRGSLASTGVQALALAAAAAVLVLGAGWRSWPPATGVRRRVAAVSTLPARALARALAVLGLTGAALLAPAAQASAAPQPIGRCTTSSGVVLAVDFSHWGRPRLPLLRDDADDRLRAAQPGRLADHRHRARRSRVHLPDRLQRAPGRQAVTAPWWAIRGTASTLCARARTPRPALHRRHPVRLGHGGRPGHRRPPAA